MKVITEDIAIAIAIIIHNFFAIIFTENLLDRDKHGPNLDGTIQDSYL